MWKVTLGYGSFPHPKVGAWPLVWARGGGGAPTSRPLGIQTRSPQRTLFLKPATVK
jgi:hypothetical protein